MTNDEYSLFVNEYVTMRIGTSPIDIEFVIKWRRNLDRFIIEQLIDAVHDVTADPRAKFPINDLPLLIEHAEDRAPRRKFIPPPPPEKIDKPEIWHRTLLEMGAITQREFNRRMKEIKS